MNVIINPGSGRVFGARLRDAWANVRAFRRELAEDWREIAIERAPKDDERGRYDFTLRLRKRSAQVSMPGIRLALVRFARGDAFSFDTPRLYVDGNSWWWPYAISVTRDALGLGTHEQLPTGHRWHVRGARPRDDLLARLRGVSVPRRLRRGSAPHEERDQADAR